MIFPKIWSKIVYFNKSYRLYTICKSKEDVTVSTGEIITVINNQYPLTNVRPPSTEEANTEYSEVNDKELWWSNWLKVIEEIEKDKELPPRKELEVNKPKTVILRETKVKEIREIKEKL